MSYPAGRIEWAWEWMGFNPPNTCYNDQPLDEKYKKFSECFDAYYGIGDFDFWKRHELSRLTELEKVELVGYLLEDFKFKNPNNPRKYLGVLADGSLNKSIDEYADGRKNFFSTLSIDECRKQVYPHNQRCRTTNGFHCDDCNTFFTTDSEDFLRTEKFSNCWNTLHNIKAICLRTNRETPLEVLTLRVEYDAMQKVNRFEIPLKELQAMLDKCNVIKGKYSKLLSKS